MGYKCTKTQKNSRTESNFLVKTINSSFNNRPVQNGDVVYLAHDGKWISTKKNQGKKGQLERVPSQRSGEEDRSTKKAKRGTEKEVQ